MRSHIYCLNGVTLEEIITGICILGADHIKAESDLEVHYQLTKTRTKQLQTYHFLDVTFIPLRLIPF